MSVSTIVNLENGEEVRHEDVDLSKTGEYPHQWFQNHPNQKPILHVPTTSTSLKDLVGLLKDWPLDQYTVKLAKMILFKYFSETTITLEEDWLSCGIEIGKRGEEVCPFSIYQVETVEEIVEGKSSTQKFDLDPFIGSLLMIHRVYLLPTSVNTTEIMTRFSQRFQSLFNSRPPFAFNAVPQTVGSWDSDLNFRKIVAAVDLFFEKFPNHQNSKMKFGTVSSKWRDCVALKSLFEIAPVLGFKKIQELTPWIWEPVLKDDAWRILCKPLALSSEDTGYIPYMSDIGLVTRSIYSATMNPAAHVFCQVIYCAMGNPRGLNARMLFPCQVRAVIRNGLMVAFALDKSHARGITLVPQSEREKYKEFQKTIEEASEARGLDNESVHSDDQEFTVSIPTVRDPRAWFAFFEDSELHPPKVYIKYLEGVRRSCQNCRVGSVGKYLYEFLGSALDKSDRTLSNRHTKPENVLENNDKIVWSIIKDN